MNTQLKAILFLLTFHYSLYCQHKVAGCLLDSINHTPIANAHIINLSSFKVTVSDSSGYFQLHIENGNKITIQSIDYNKKTLTFDSLYKDTITIYLHKTTYPIREVKVGILGNYQQFRENFLKLDPNKSKFKIQGMPEPKRRAIPILEDKEYWNKPALILVSPVSYLYYNTSKHAKAIYKYHDYKKQYNEQLRADAKFNKELVTQLTGLIDEPGLSNFMLYCNFSHDFNMQTSELSLCELIMAKYGEYKKEASKKSY